MLLRSVIVCYMKESVLIFKLFSICNLINIESAGKCSIKTHILIMIVNQIVGYLHDIYYVK